MSSPNDYDAQVEAIREYNAPILSEFQKSLEKAGLSKKTVKSHVDNIDFFTEYLMYYEPLSATRGRIGQVSELSGQASTITPVSVRSGRHW